MIGAAGKLRERHDSREIVRLPTTLAVDAVSNRQRWTYASVLLFSSRLRHAFNAAHVCLDRRFGEHPPLGDLAVGKTAC